jgi:hypothetical protein
MRLNLKTVTVVLGFWIVSFPAGAAPKEAVRKLSSNRGITTSATTAAGNIILWKDPSDIASRDLFYGPGGQSHQPAGGLTFVKEDLSASNPKFLIRDADGIEWKVKLGGEVRSETAATG